MQNVAKLFNGPMENRYLGPAEIVGVAGRGDEAEVKIGSLYADERLVAQSAVTQALAPGDQVLVIMEERATIYIIGILNRSAEKVPEEHRLELPDGTHVVADGSVHQPMFKIYSNQNQLMLEYDAAAAKVSVVAREADLHVTSSRGNMTFEASDAIRLEADRVDIVGRSRIGFTLGKAYERLKSTMTFLPGIVELAAQKLDLTAKRGEVDLEEVRCRSKKVTSRIGRLQTVAEKIDVAARTLIERTKSSYRWSEELSQLRSGRMRMIINKTFHIKSKNAIMTSDEDVKINAEKIHLG